MGTPPNQTGKRFLNRKSTIDCPVDEAISPEYAQHLLEELIALEPKDIKQLRKQMNDLFLVELETLNNKFTKFKNIIYEIKYERSPAGLTAREKRNEKRREQKRNQHHRTKTPK